VQATGHGLPLTHEGGVLIGTCRMTGVRVDAPARTAWFEAGVRWGQVIEEAARYGLAPLSGSSPDVGAVGYTLAGGLPMLARQYGYAADHVRSLDVVTADAVLRHLTADSDPDLFWAFRGASSNFGVVTGMQVSLVPVARLYAGGMYFDSELVPDVLSAFTSWTLTVPEELTSSVSMLQYPNVPAIPEPIRGRYVAHVRIAYTGQTAEGERLVGPLRAIGPRLIDTVKDMPYTDSGAISSDPTKPHAYYGSNVLVDTLDASALQAVAGVAGPDAPVRCVVDVRHLGGATARPPAVPNAVGHRHAQYIVRVLSGLSESGVELVKPVHQRLYDTLATQTIGRRLGFIYGERSTTHHIRASFEPDDYQRLSELKAIHDPANTFRLNYNIPPAKDQRS
jgi:FAD binding domain